MEKTITDAIESGHGDVADPDGGGGGGGGGSGGAGRGIVDDIYTSFSRVTTVEATETRDDKGKSRLGCVTFWAALFHRWDLR